MAKAIYVYKQFTDGQDYSYTQLKREDKKRWTQRRFIKRLKNTLLRSNYKDRYQKNGRDLSRVIVNWRRSKECGAGTQRQSRVTVYTSRASQASAEASTTRRRGDSSTFGFHRRPQRPRPAGRRSERSPWDVKARVGPLNESAASQNFNHFP